MKFSYEDLISGDAIFVKGIGHFRSPLLKELKPSGSIGAWMYQLYLNILSWDKKSCLDFMKIMTKRKLTKLEENEKVTTFDVMTILDEPRELLQNAMAFFMCETLTWDKISRAFITTSTDKNETIGSINREYSTHRRKPKSCGSVLSNISKNKAANPVKIKVTPLVTSCQNCALQIQAIHYSTYMI